MQCIYTIEAQAGNARSYTHAVSHNKEKDAQRIELCVYIRTGLQNLLIYSIQNSLPSLTTIQPVSRQVHRCMMLLTRQSREL